MDPGFTGRGQTPPGALTVPMPPMPPEGDELLRQWKQPEGSPAQEPNLETYQFAIAGTEPVGTVLLTKRSLGFRARSLRAFNTSNLVLVVGQVAFIPAACFEYWSRILPAVDQIEIKVYATAAGAGDLWVTFTEEEATNVPRGK